MKEFKRMTGIKVGVTIMIIGFFANLFFGGGADSGVDLFALVQGGALVVDVRTAGEFSGGHIDGAVNIPYDVITSQIATYAPEKDRSIIVYCRSGSRSGVAKKYLQNAGYTNVVNGGGFGHMRRVLAK